VLPVPADNVSEVLIGFDDPPAFASAKPTVTCATDRGFPGHSLSLSNVATADPAGPPITPQTNTACRRPYASLSRVPKAIRGFASAIPALN